jgi:hypothetical protein
MFKRNCVINLIIISLILETTHLIDGRLKLLGQVRISRRHLVRGGNATVGGARTSETAGTNDKDRHLRICCYLIIVTFQNIYIFFTSIIVSFQNIYLMRYLIIATFQNTYLFCYMVSNFSHQLIYLLA